ncbi:MAG: cache domain-containing protein [Elusimicrobiales bacterium]|nr:cache domain-containing protein [Elusimicrobiales bacterium]
MNKKVLYVSAVFVMFLSPFLILAGHFMNTVESVSLNYVLSAMELGINSLSSRITSVLIDKYDALKEIRDLKSDKDIVGKIKSVSNSQVVKKISYYSKEGNLIYSSYPKENKKISGDYIFESAKTVDVPIGVISYPQDAPPELVVVEKISGGFVVVVADLGYLNEIIFKLSKKIIGKIYLIDGSYNVIFDSDYDYVVNNQITIDSDIKKFIDGLKSQNIYSYKGVINIKDKKYLVSISNVETTNWWVYNIMDYDKAMDFGLKRWAKRVVWSGIIIILIFSIATFLIFAKIYCVKK